MVFVQLQNTYPTIFLGYIDCLEVDFEANKQWVVIEIPKYLDAFNLTHKKILFSNNFFLRKVKATNNNSDSFLKFDTEHFGI